MAEKGTLQYKLTKITTKTVLAAVVAVVMFYLAKDKKLEAVVEKVLNNPLIDVDVASAKGMLIDVTGGPTMTLEEANKVVDLIGQKLPEDINIIWGAHIFPDLKNTIKTLVIITGVSSRQITGKSISEDKQLKERQEVEEELGITFLT